MKLSCRCAAILGSPLWCAARVCRSTIDRSRREGSAGRLALRATFQIECSRSNRAHILFRAESRMYSTSQKLIAEFLGTFALIFFGAGSFCADQYLHGAGGLGFLGIALTHGLAIGIMVSALGHISGGHFI